MVRTLSHVQRAACSAFTRGALALLVIVFFAAITPSASAQCGHWLEGEGVPGTNKVAYTTFVFDDGNGPALYIGGSFTIAGPVSANHVVKWDGDHFTPLGAGIDDAVKTFAVFNGQLVAGCDRGVFVWNGVIWTRIGSPVYAVACLAQYQGQLYAGTDSTASSSGLFRWDGAAWQAVGGGLVKSVGIPTVADLVVYNNELYSTGYFDGTATINSPGIIKWNGSAYSAVGTGGLNSSGGKALALFGSDLIIGGLFSSAGGVATTGIARWNGTAFSSMSLPGAKVYDLTIHNDELYAGGEFNLAGGFNAVARWTGSGWADAGAAFTGEDDRNAQVVTMNSFGGDLIAGGRVTAVNNLGVRYICRRTGSVWRGFSKGLDGPVYAMAAADNQLFIGGAFSTVDGRIARGIAAWDGVNWNTLGGGISNGEFLTSVRAITVLGSDVYIGGFFHNVGGVVVTGVAKWDGVAWSNPGTGFPDSEVNAMTVFNGKVIAAANIESSTGITEFTVYSLNNGIWQPLGTVLHGFGYGQTLALAVYNNALYVGGAGFYTDSDPRGGCLFRLNAGVWERIADATGSVQDLLPFGTDLIVGGAFSTIGGTVASNIARYNGANFFPVGAGVGPGGPQIILSLCEYNGGFVAFGNFHFSGTTPLNHITFWIGDRYQAFDGGIAANYSENGAVISFLGELYAGGSFETAGGQVSAYFAHWGGSADPCIQVNPTATVVCPTKDVRFSAVATGTPQLSYHWRRNTQPLNDGPTGTGATITGALTREITIQHISAADTGQYDVVVTNNEGNAVSAAATINLLPDFNADGVYNTLDLLILLGKFGQGVPPYTNGDANGDGTVGTLDLTAFLSVFGQSCH